MTLTQRSQYTLIKFYWVTIIFIHLFGKLQHLSHHKLIPYLMIKQAYCHFTLVRHTILLAESDSYSIMATKSS